MSARDVQIECGAGGVANSVIGSIIVLVIARAVGRGQTASSDRSCRAHRSRVDTPARVARPAARLRTHLGESAVGEPTLDAFEGELPATHLEQVGPRADPHEPAVSVDYRHVLDLLVDDDLKRVLG